MRSYLTRHGNGPMPNEDKTLTFEDETNKPHKYQGVFRQGWHSLEEIKYAIVFDSAFSGHDFIRKNLVISCLDQTNEEILIDGERISVDRFLLKLPNFNSVITNNSINVESMYEYEQNYKSIIN